MHSWHRWSPFIAVFLTLGIITATVNFKNPDFISHQLRQIQEKIKGQPEEKGERLKEEEPNREQTPQPAPEQTPEPPPQKPERSTVSEWSSKIQEKAKSMPSPATEPHTQEPVPLEGGTERYNREIGVQDLTALFPKDIIREGSHGKPSVALTFDDGPDGVFTPAILDILKQYGVKATFFVTAARSNQFPQILQRIVNEGHAVGQHGYSHGNYSTLTSQGIIADLKRTDDTIYNYTKVRTRLFRPPYGALTENAARTIINEGYKIILWSIDSLDWRNLSKAEVKNNILPNVRNGSIILQHCAGGQGQDLSGTVQALPEIITTLKNAGFMFKTISALLHDLGSTQNIIDVR
jgi:peptidoglycan/xylan/chitin deacetylase (PgdA/CDA1 family)